MKFKHLPHGDVAVQNIVVHFDGLLARSPITSYARIYFATFNKPHTQSNPNVPMDRARIYFATFNKSHTMEPQCADGPIRTNNKLFLGMF